MALGLVSKNPHENNHINYKKENPMTQFKPLKWHTHNDLDGVYATLEGLKWRYSILVHRKEKVELALLDADFEYISGFPKFCKSIPEAQEKAADHYNLLLQNFIVKEV